jgi:hypothetical protein
MFSNVATINIVINVDEEVICITVGMQTSDASVSEELGYDNSRGKDDAKGLNMNENPPLHHQFTIVDLVTLL